MAGRSSAGAHPLKLEKGKEHQDTVRTLIENSGRGSEIDKSAEVFCLRVKVFLIRAWARMVRNGESSEVFV